MNLVARTPDPIPSGSFETYRIQANAVPVSGVQDAEADPLKLSQPVLAPSQLAPVDAALARLPSTAQALLSYALDCRHPSIIRGASRTGAVVLSQSQQARLQRFSERRLAYAAILATRLPQRVWVSRGKEGRCEALILAMMLIFTRKLTSDEVEWVMQDAVPELYYCAYSIGQIGLRPADCLPVHQLADEKREVFCRLFWNTERDFLHDLKWNLWVAPEALDEVICALRELPFYHIGAAEKSFSELLFVEAAADIFIQEEWLDWTGVYVVARDPSASPRPPLLPSPPSFCEDSGGGPSPRAELTCPELPLRSSRLLMRSNSAPE